jgi:monoamine oxidase
MVQQQRENHMVTTADPGHLARRSLLRAMTALVGSAALPPLAARAARAAKPDLPNDFGKGRTVAVIGAGMAGLTAGWKLANAGFKVTIYEGDSRFGGRSLTVRPQDTAYRDWWFRKYNSQRLFREMYVSQYRERSGTTDPQLQVCKFKDESWNPTSGRPPVELFLNAGPGRIPSDHAALLALCGEIGVPLEPYIFQSNYNLLKSKTFRDGTPTAYNQINYSLRGEIAAKLAKAENARCGADADALGRMLKEMGDLNARCEYKGSPRLGYSALPGGWDTPGTVKDSVTLEDVLSSGFGGGGNPELSPGSFLFNADNILWQNSLMQPIGGMDRIWQRLLVQRISSHALNLRSDDPRSLELSRRGERYVGDLALLNHRVTSIADVTNGTKIAITYERTDAEGRVVGQGVERADFCISTMAPNLLAKVWNRDREDDPYKKALMAVAQTPAIKVGWQAKSRFWEKESHIYGGISWTDDEIGQIWYPSEDFNASTGVLTGAYNRGPTAEVFGKLEQKARIEKALEGGAALHPGFRDKVYIDRGVTIAWHNMPFQVGGWAGLTAVTQPDVYKAIIKPQGRLYAAGDAYSYLPGWLEGAVTSVYEAIKALPKA